MTVKLLMTWDILPGREQEYFEFVVRDLIPGMQHLGLEPSDAWFTMYGDQPQILAIVQSSSMANLEEVLASSDWEKITQQLLDYVEDLKYKVVSARTGFQL
ncbi:MAG: NIPSNAP family protein [Anaerolineales bacterium]|nr:NIPSNAP family protein [Anaerolineales bacterium]